MPVNENAIVKFSDYNNIQNVISTVLGRGIGGQGYGQRHKSVSIPAHRLVSDRDWDNLRDDIIQARVHQSGVAFSSNTIVSFNENTVIGAAAINNYENNAIIANSQRFNVAAGQFVVNSRATVARRYGPGTSGPTFWSNEISCILTVSFPATTATATTTAASAADNARYFFNSGGEVRIQSSRTPGRTDAQNNEWTAMLSSGENFRFGVQFPLSGFFPLNGGNFYRLTTSFQQVFARASSGIYAANRYVIEARSNVNNSAGDATLIEFRIRFIGGYVDPGPGGTPDTNDEIDGTFTVSVDEKKAANTLTIPSPTYTFTSIFGS